MYLAAGTRGDHKRWGLCVYTMSHTGPAEQVTYRSEIARWDMNIYNISGTQVWFKLYMLGKVSEVYVHGSLKPSCD